MNFLKKILKQWYILIGILIFFYIIFCQIDLAKLLRVLADANAYLIILAVAVSLIMSFVQPARWNYLKKNQGINYRFKDSFLIYNGSFFFSAITPGHLGDLIKATYLKKDGYSIGKSLVSVILDRLADVSFLFLVGYLSMFFFAKFFIKYIILLSCLILIVATVAYFFNRKKLPKIIVGKILKFIIPAKYQKSWHLSCQDFINGFKAYPLKIYLNLFLITVANWLLYYLAFFLMAKSIGVNVPLIFLSMSITIATLATLIPISIAGLGTRDAVLLLLLSLFKVSPEKIIGLSVLYLLLLLATVTLGFVCWLKKPLKFTSKNIFLNSKGH